jgi:hypothetical protein
MLQGEQPGVWILAGAKDFSVLKNLQSSPKVHTAYQVGSLPWE